MMRNDHQDGQLGELLKAWGQHVDKLDTERALSGSDPAVRDDPKVWGAHDLPAALYLRDRIREAVDRGIATPAAVAELERVDDQFRAATVDDAAGLIGKLLDEDVSGRGWWWHRVPASGPVAEELRDYFG